MLINCFRAAGGSQLTIDDDRPTEAPRRPVSSPKKSNRFHAIKRQGSDTSHVSSTSSKSNESISKLPPCNRSSDSKIEAMMMPYPYEPRPSRCLRLSHPKIYSGLVSDMKAEKKCRDWRNFAVFYADDVDMSITADEAARKRALDYQRKLRQLNCSWTTFDSGPSSDRSTDFELVG